MSASVKVEVRQITTTASEAVARQHHVTTDRPEAKGELNVDLPAP